MKLEIINWPKNYCTYQEVAEMYSMTGHYIKKFAREANAVIRLGSKRLNLIDRRIFDDYLKTHNPGMRGYHKREQEVIMRVRREEMMNRERSSYEAGS